MINNSQKTADQIDIKTQIGQTLVIIERLLTCRYSHKA